VRRLLFEANGPSSPILVTIMIEALCSSETSVLTRATRSNIPEDGIIHLCASTACYGDGLTFLYVSTKVDTKFRRKVAVDKSV
jgi:hypothetical protein